MDEARQSGAAATSRHPGLAALGQGEEGGGGVGGGREDVGGRLLDWALLHQLGGGQLAGNVWRGV